MEGFVAVAKAQGDESQLSSSNSLDSSTSYSGSCRASNPTKGYSSYHRHHNNDLSRSREQQQQQLLDNGHYWKYLTANNTGAESGNMIPQEPTMASNDGVSKTPSPSSTSAMMAEDSLTSASRTDTTTTIKPGESSPTDRESPSTILHNNNTKTKMITPVDSQSIGGSDVERFDGKIVYNPDGSAYIIEESEMSEDDASLDVPHLEGCIVDGRGVSLSPFPAIPQIANAFYVSRNPALYNALYGQAYSSLLQDKKIVPEIPIMHSYRVYSVRDNKISDTVNASDDEGKAGSTTTTEERTSSESTSKGALTSSTSECSSVPIKPILMCFICKLSFGYTKSFIAHGMGDHNLILIDQEKDILNQRNVSAIIQPVGKNKDPSLSFLEPVTSRKATALNLHQQSSVPMNRALHHHQQLQSPTKNSSDLPIKSSPINSPELLLASPRQSSINNPNSSSGSSGMDLTRKSPASSGRSSASPGANNNNNNASPVLSTPLNNLSPSGSQMCSGPPNFITGTTIGVCPEHMNGRPSGVECAKCEMILTSSRMGALGNLHTRNSCKTLKCPKCNWHYKYEETLQIHLKEKHPETEQSCIYCVTGQPHPRLARGETYTCGYKPYRCEVCNYSTTTKGNLSIHMQSDKHLNNMQELQNGGGVPPVELVQQTPPPHPPKSMAGMSPSAVTPPSAPPPASKPKPTFRCDVCNYETNVARNLRIHMTSEKHTHNMMVLQQNVKHMQHLNALQQAQQNPFDPTTLLQFHPQLQQLAAAAAASATSGDKGSASHPEAALADMAYNQALLIQMMTGGQLPPHIPPELAPHMDMGLNPDTMEPPPEPPDPNPNHIYQCCVCTVFTTDSLETLSHHLSQDRTKLREQEILVLVAGNYMCKLCSYKTNLKANFQLHCKTDKHLQRLQHVNHVKEGGIRNEWKLKYLSMSNPVQVRCNVCDYYTNSAHKLQMHSSHTRHDISVLIFRHIQSVETTINEDCRIYACALCGFTTRVKLQLLQHTRSLKHLQLEQLHCLQERAKGKDGQPDLAQIFRVLEQPDSDSSGNNNHSSADISPNFYDDQEMKRGDDTTSSSVLKHALEKESSSTDMNDLTCPYCNFSSESETRLQAHILTQHSNSESSGSSSRDRERLRDHSAQHHHHHHRNSISPDSKSELVGTSSLEMTCPLCQESCSDRSSLEAHVMQVHSVNSEGLQRLLVLVNQSHWLNSSTSSGRSNNNNNNNNNNDSNDDDKDKSESESECDEFRCGSCSKSFRTLDELCAHQNEFGHLEIKATPTGGVGYLCWKKGCNQYFPNVSALQTHFREIHARGQPAMAVSEKHAYRYRCSDCSLAFKTAEKLQLHSQYHLIRDASKCPLCGRSFRSVAALQKHVETSHTELSEEELLQLKENLASNPLLLAGLSGQVLDPVTNELLKKESARDDDNVTDEDMNREREDSSPDKEDRMVIDETMEEDNNSDSISKEQQMVEEYLNSQKVAEDSYNDGDRKYKCHKCKVAFTRQSYLTSHNKTLQHRKGMGTSYPMEKYLDPMRPFKCNICMESFTQKNILLVHYNSVSHLHKLKKAIEQQQHTSGQIPASLAASLPPSAASLVTSLAKQSATTTTTSSAPSGVNTSSSPSHASDDDENRKGYRCNICKVAYSQGSTLDIHLRSVLHQTRASKLQELAMTGQIDLTKPLIEQPEPQQVKKGSTPIHDVLSPKDESTPVSFSTPIRASSPASNRSRTPNTSPPNTSVSPIVSSSPQAFSCSRCNFLCGSQEQLIQHKHLYCIFQSSNMPLFPQLQSPTQTGESHGHHDGPSSPASHDDATATDEHIQRFHIPSRRSSHMLKHLLESYGFEMVMQFNEYHQKRLKRDEEDEDNVRMELEEQIAKEFPELAKSTCPYCKKVFSSVWILKAHCEEIHKNVISMEMLENFAEAFRGAYLKKMENTEAGDQEGDDGKGEPLTSSSGRDNPSGVHPTAPSTPTASITPGSSADSVSGNNPSSSSGPGGLPSSSNSNLPLPLAQHMNDLQAALSAMAASQLQHFNPMLNPMMMASLGMGLPLGLNMNALAAMNLQPPLVPMMIPPQFDPRDMNMNQGATTPPLFSQRVDPAGLAKQQQQLLQQQQASAANQKRARTRITDDQLKVLRAHFDINNSPSEQEYHQLADQTGLPIKVLRHWYRNTLFKERQRNKDSPYNFSNPPSTTLNLEEYEKTGEAKVTQLPLEEQKQYVDIPASINKKEKKSSSSQHQQQQLQHDIKLFNHDSQSELSETDSRYEDEKPAKMPRKGSPSPFRGLNKNVPEPSTNNSSSQSSSLNLTSLITSQLVNPQQEDSKINLPPPPKMSNFATPSQVPNASLLSLASPVSLNSPGSGRSDTPLTTPPLPNSANTSSSSSSGKRANRTRFTDYQIKVLQEFFENNAYPKDDDLEYLSKLLSLSPRVIVVWFQNARQKARKVYENQPPVDSGDEGTGRFQRTPGLNYQCKKCLLVFQRYYELIRHQKTHCFKEEDAKRSAQAQAAAAQVAAAMSSEDSNSSTVTDNNSLASSCGPSPVVAPNTQSSSGRESANPNNNTSQPSGGNNSNATSLFANELKKLESQNDSFQCDKCNLVFPRFDLWREHQLVHIMNPNLFPSFSPESPFGILQQHALQQQQQQQQQQAQGQSQQHNRESNESNSTTSSIAGDATAKRKWSADELMTDDDKDEQPRDKRLRTTILPEQLDYLYQKYQVESNPSRKMLETIAREVGLKKRVVQVWFQNTRARERKGQFRAHAQVINKRCPFCPALFKVKSALETHLAAKHADQYTKGEINIDALPDEEIDPASSPLGDNKVPISFGANSTNSLGAAPTSPSSTNIMTPFLHSLSTHAELESSLKKLYEESLKRYAQEVQQATSQNGCASKSSFELPSPGGGGLMGDSPLDLSKPVDLTRALGKAEAMDTSFLDSQDYLSDDDEMHIDTYHDHHDSSPNSSASSTASQRPTGQGTNSSSNGANKRFRTQLAAFQVKVMKSLFADYKTPTMAECEMLGRELGLVKRVVQVWYQNQRAKLKRETGKSVHGKGEELPTECKLCKFKYSTKYSVQDHIFTKQHIDVVKASIGVNNPKFSEDDKKADTTKHQTPASVSSDAMANQSLDEMMNFLQVYGLSTSSTTNIPSTTSTLPTFTGEAAQGTTAGDSVEESEDGPTTDSHANVFGKPSGSDD